MQENLLVHGIVSHCMVLLTFHAIGRQRMVFFLRPYLNISRLSITPLPFYFFFTVVFYLISNISLKKMLLLFSVD